MDFREINPLWALADPLTVPQAAALMADVDPNAVAEEGYFFRDRETGLTCSDGIAYVQTAYTALVNAIEARNLKARLRYDAEPRYTAGIDNLKERGYWGREPVVEIKDWDDTSYVIAPVPNWATTTVTKVDLVGWLSSSPIKPSFFFPDSPTIPTKEQADRYIAGATSARLRQAIDAFPEKYPSYREKPPKLDADVRDWLGKTFGCSEREKHVFGQIIWEHFGLNQPT